MQLSEWVQYTLPKVLSEISSAKLAQEESLRMLTRPIYQGTTGQAVEVERFLSQYHTAVSALLLTSAPQHFPGAWPVYKCSLHIKHIDFSAAF
jgi:hypothetical protein